MSIVPDLGGNVPLNAPSADPHFSANVYNASNSVLVVPSDTKDVATGPSVYISCDVGGAVHYTGEGGKQDTITLQAGYVQPLRVRRVWATSTTATGIHLFYDS